MCMLALAIIAVSLRISSRWVRKAPLGLDDYLIICSLVRIPFETFSSWRVLIQSVIDAIHHCGGVCHDVSFLLLVGCFLN